MKRTTISLPDDLAQALNREVRRRHTSASEVARDALTQLLGLSTGKPRELPFAALGHSGTHTTARDMEKLLEEEWNDDAGRR
jgi:Arc/MetJ-type ribon-helix-helix transcriptional regulator